MDLHISWPNWQHTLCDSEDQYSWEFYQVKVQREIYLREDREEDFKELYCPKCLDLFLNLITLSSDERREARNKKWEEEINKKNIEYNVSLKDFELYRLEMIPQKYERFRIVKSLEKQYKIDEIKDVDNITKYLYQEGSLCFTNGTYLASILTIGSAIEHFIHHSLNPRLKYKDYFLRKVFDDAVDKNIITNSLKEEILEFRRVIRNQVAHPRSPSFNTLGMIYKEAEGHWESLDRKPIYTGPRIKALEGIEIFCKTVSYYIYKAKGKIK
ncbi:MAG: hypothetical protein KAU62_02395 [Candidatus Heimdallarchaeota archaeon]|nr:hypothetical protein [Candidatus Heimdallarchaeota archaeon]MCK4609985.1 hypothetical protein [Candidatus Heimdallarchaeota archaeon]